MEHLSTCLTVKNIGYSFITTVTVLIDKQITPRKSRRLKFSRDNKIVCKLYHYIFLYIVVPLTEAILIGL